MNLLSGDVKAITKLQQLSGEYCVSGWVAGRVENQLKNFYFNFYQSSENISDFLSIFELHHRRGFLFKMIWRPNWKMCPASPGWWSCPRPGSRRGGWTWAPPGTRGPGTGGVVSSPPPSCCSWECSDSRARSSARRRSWSPWLRAQYFLLTKKKWEKLHSD